MKKSTVDQLPEVRIRVSFVECLEILWITEEKPPESTKTNIPTSFFGNLRKSSEIFGKNRKSSEKTGKCRKVLKTTFQHFKIIS